MDESDVSVPEFEEPAQILYDIVPYREWEQEPEVLKYPDKPSGLRGGYWPFQSGPASPLPQAAERILGHRLPWQFAVSQDANLVALLQENVLEIWHSKENYGTLVGRRGVRRDPAPSWRNLAWSEDAQLLVLTYSDGTVELCDTLGGMIYQIISPKIPSSQPGFVDALRKGPSDLSYLCVFFTNTRLREKKWISELVLVDLGGRINSFLVSTSGYQELSSYSVGWNLTSAVYSPNHNILLTAGQSPLCGRSHLVGRASHSGILSYRLLNDAPHFSPLTDDTEQLALGSKSFSLPFISAPQVDHIIRMAVSENGRRLGAIHESGSISVWILPGLTLSCVTRLVEQPGYDEVNPALLQSPSRKKMKTEFLGNPFRFHPADIAWWNEESLTISRISGALSVLRMEDLSNLLGDSPEFLDGVPRISQSFEKGFFALECESTLKGRRPSILDDSAGEDPDVEVEVDTDDEEGSWLSLGKRSATSLAYYMTDNERFAPPKKKSKMVKRVYRLIGLVSTNPEELYTRKIDSEEYGEAIMLAQHYRLDTDPVYERQWRRSNKSVAAIHDYLGKIKRRVSVLKECLETIPGDIDAARELLSFGIRGTDLESLIALAGGGDSGEFLQSETERVYEDWSVDGLDPRLQAQQKEERECAARFKLIAKVNWQTLSLVQKDLIAARLKFLYYLDILDVYEDALGGGQFAADRFNPDVYRRMRSLSPLENCLFAARNSDPITIAAFFTGIHSHVVLPHWLPILSAFPETTKPNLLQDILPGLSMTGQPIPWLTVAGRAEDWAEQPISSKWSGHSVQYESSMLYQEDPSLQSFHCKDLSDELVTQWYESRVRTIIQRTRLPELGLELLKLGQDRNIVIYVNLVNNLRTLEALVYEVQSDLDLETFERMSLLEQMDSLLSRTSDLLQDIRYLLVPYLYRLEEAKPGEYYTMLYAFCLSKAATDLSVALAVVENSGLKSPAPILQNPRQIVQLALDCCYAHVAGDQVHLMDRMGRTLADYFELAPGRLGLDFIQEHRLDRDQFTSFLQHLEAAKLLAKHGVRRPLSVFKAHISDRTVMQKIFEAVTCQAEATRPSLDQDGWRSVLRDLQRLQKLVPVVSVQTVFYMFCESLLSSGSAANIELAGDVMKTMLEGEDQVKLVVSAWAHYFSTSASLKDPNMELAKHCLCLVKPGAKEIDDCADLISSLLSLADFGLSDIHPISVLKSTDRLEFVVKALNSRPTSYKNSQRLMKLASLLKVETLENLEGLVWTLIAKKALEVKDLPSCHTACNNIIQCGYVKGWDVCFALGVQAEFQDMQKGSDLLAFAVTHCDEANIENVVLSLLKVEQTLLHSTLAGQADPNMELEFVDVEDEGEDRFEDTVEEIKSREVSPSFPSVTDVKNTILNVTGLSTQYLMDNEISRTVLEHTSSWIRQIAKNEVHESFTEEEVGKNFDHLRFPAFYCSLFATAEEGVLESLVDPNYRRFSAPRVECPVLVAAQQALRSQLISGVLLDLHGGREPAVRRISGELLQQLVPIIASQDVFQGLCLLLCLVEEQERRSLLQSLPLTVPSLNFIITFLAFLINSQQEAGRREHIFNQSPKHLLITALQAGGDTAESALLKEFLDISEDHNQARVLSALAGEVDIARFSRDHQYKEDTILGLARLLEEENWAFTSTLSRRYHVDSWILAATHTEAIFVENEDTEAVRAMLESRGLTSTLASDPSRWRCWGEERILPLLDGTDYRKLVLYFQTMQEITKDGEYQEHKKAVDLLEEAGVQVDYLRLLAGDVSSLAALDLSRMEAVVKAARKIPPAVKTRPTAAQIYLSFADREFYRRGVASGNWVESFSHCQDILEKLDPASFKKFITSILLAEKYLGEILRGARNRILKKSIKLIEIKIAEKAEGDWSLLDRWTAALKTHMERFTSKLAEVILSGLTEEEGKVVGRLELTGGEEEEIVRLLVNLIHTGTQEQLIRKLIVLWKKDDSVIEDGFAEIFSFCVDSLRSSRAEDSRELTHCVQRLLEEFDYSPEAVRLVLAPLCTQETLPVSDRLVFVQLLRSRRGLEQEQAAEQQEEFDSSFLSELYEVQEKIQNVVEGAEISERDLESPEAKHRMVQRIIELCVSTDQLDKLVNFCKVYFSGEVAALRGCLVQLAVRCLSTEQLQSRVLDLVLACAEQLGPEDVNHVLNTCLDTRKEVYVQLVLRLQKKEHYAQVPKVLNELESLESRTLVYIIEQGLGAELASSPHYQSLLEVALAEDLADTLVEQLMQAGHRPLALALQLLSSGVPAALRTMAAFRLK